MGDPIDLLDCLEKNAGGITEQDSKGTAFLHVVPIGKPRPQLGAILAYRPWGRCCDSYRPVFARRSRRLRQRRVRERIEVIRISPCI